MIRAVLDANVIISGTIAPHGASAGILQAWRADYFEVVTCEAVLREVTDKLYLPRIRKKYPVSNEDIAHLLMRFSQAAYFVPGLAAVDPSPPDPKDIMLFSAADESNADYVVTGNKPLLTFTWNGRARVVSPRVFLHDELPREVVRALSYPVFALEDIPETGLFAVEIEQAQKCVALFSTQEAAGSFRLRRNILGELLTFNGRQELMDSLTRVTGRGQQRVALNPTEQYCITESIDVAIEALSRPK